MGSEATGGGSRGLEVTRGHLDAFAGLCLVSAVMLVDLRGPDWPDGGTFEGHKSEAGSRLLASLKTECARVGLCFGDWAMFLRVALIGETVSEPIEDLLRGIGAEEVLRRLVWLKVAASC